MLSRKTLKILARLALTGFLFAQAALAVAACKLAQPSAAQAILNAGAAASEPCHEQGDDSAALCVAHCVTESQSLEKPFWKLPAPAAAPAPAFLIVLAPVVVPPPAIHLPHALAGPPRRILYRTLLI